MIAADLMTENPRTIRQTATVGEALDTLQSLEIRHLPVLDDDDNLVGVLSDRDLGALMRTFTEGADADRIIVPISHKRVTDFMSTDVVFVDPDAELSEIIDTMLVQRIGAVPVVDGQGDVLGIISYVDVLRAIAGELQTDAGVRPKGRTSRRHG